MTVSPGSPSPEMDFSRGENVRSSFRGPVVGFPDLAVLRATRLVGGLFVVLRQEFVCSSEPLARFRVMFVPERQNSIEIEAAYGIPIVKIGIAREDRAESFGQLVRTSA